MSETWIVVADRATARIFDPDGPHGRWDMVHEFIHNEAREANQKLRGNRPDQIQHTEERLHPAKMDPRSIHKVEEDRFAKELCAYLEKSYLAKAFQALVLVAAPSFLGSLRRHLRDWLKEKVTLELDKDYGHLKPHQLAATVQVP
jgi:protein required for attachment to host cells